MKTLRELLTIGTILPALMVSGGGRTVAAVASETSTRSGALILAQAAPTPEELQRRGPPGSPSAPRPPSPPRPEQVRPVAPPVAAPHPVAPRPEPPRPAAAPRPTTVQPPFAPPPERKAAPVAPSAPAPVMREKPSAPVTHPSTAPLPGGEHHAPGAAKPNRDAPPPAREGLPIAPGPQTAPRVERPPQPGAVMPTAPLAPSAPAVGGATHPGGVSAPPSGTPVIGAPPSGGAPVGAPGGHPIPPQGDVRPPQAPGVGHPVPPQGEGRPPQMPGAGQPMPPQGMGHPLPPQGEARPRVGVGAAVGAAAVGAAVGVVGGMILGGEAKGLDDVHRQRRETVRDGATVYSEPGRVIVRDERGLYLRHDENERFRGLDGEVTTERRGDESIQIWRRPDGVRIVTVTDEDGRLLRRIRRWPDGREEILIDNARRPRPARWSDEVVVLPPPVTRERLYLDTENADEGEIYDMLSARPLAPLPRRYSLDEIRVSRDLRAYMPAVDVDTVTFASGSWEVEPGQIARLAVLAKSIQRILAASPDEIFLVEGHTDAVGSDIDNLSLSDRRAASVASILTREFGVPPENLTTQGYGEQVLKEATSGPSRINRRVTVRRITPLLDTSSGR